MPITVSPELEEKVLETSRKPAEIYKMWNNYNSYFLTSGDAPITFESQLYSPASLSRSGTQMSADMSVSQITVDAHYLDEEIVQYLAAAPLDQTWLQISRVFRDQDPMESLVYFIGVFDNVSFKGQKATIRANGVEKLLRVPVPKYRYQPRCNHKLYSDACGVAKAIYEVDETVVSVSASGNTITMTDLSAFDDGYFNLGYIQPVDSAPRMITNHVGNVLTVRHLIPGLGSADTVKLYPGCDKLPATCKNKFLNLGNPALDRFMGFIYIPDDNPCVWTN